MLDKKGLPYRKAPTARIWDARSFCIAHFDICQSDVNALSYDLTFGGFVHNDSSNVAAYLPQGWTATELLVHFDNGAGGHYDNDWGYKVFVGPTSLIEKLAEAELTRSKAATVVRNILGSRDTRPDTPRPQIYDSRPAGVIHTPHTFQDRDGRTALPV